MGRMLVSLGLTVATRFYLIWHLQRFGVLQRTKRSKTESDTLVAGTDQAQGELATEIKMET